MVVKVTHSTPADGTFSATGAAAWNADHSLSGLGTMAEQNANNVNITGGVISGITGLAASGANSDITSLSGLTTPLSVAQGGSGTATPSLVAGAKIAVSGSWPNQTVATTGAAASGANSDITSLSGLTTPLSVGQGGSGTAAPSLVAGANISISGSWPNQTIATSGVLTGLTVNSTPTSGGAAGQIMFDTGSVLQESSNLLWDNTNKTLTLTGYSLTGSSAFSQLDLSGTWNTTGTPTAIKLTITDTASNASSLLMDLRVGASSIFSVRKSGLVSIPRGSSIVSGYWLSTDSQTGIYAPNNQQLYVAGGGTIVEVRASGLGLGSTALSWGALGATQDLVLTRRGAANLRFGAADAAAPVAQTLSVQSVVAGTSNTAGANLTITGSQGTGTGAGGDIIFQTALAGTSGTAQNSLITALRIYSNQTVAVGKAYTVATLPAAGTQGRRAWVTDATAPTFLGALIGGGAVVCPVFDNGTAWVAG